MRTRPALVAATALLFGAAPAGADYWVSIGAFRSVQSATKLAADAQAKAGLFFAASAVQTQEGSTLHRVTAGPFATREEAAMRVEQVRHRGFSDAWVLELDAGAIRSAAG